jgi:serpin B
MPLVALGLKPATAQNLRDFSGLSDFPVYISDVEQMADITTDEKGTTAIADTTVTLSSFGVEAGPKPAPQIVTVDHPFLYLIMDARSGTLLFMGRVCDPEK